MTSTEKDENSSEGPLRGPWLNPDQVAKYLNLKDRKSVYAAAKRGAIPAYRWGGKLRFRREEIDQVLSGCKLEPRARKPKKEEPDDDRANSKDQRLRR